MKKIYIALLIVSFAINAQAQNEKLTSDYKKEVIEQVVELVNDNYVFPDVAKTTGESLVKKLKEGRFDNDSTIAAFAKSLTEEVQLINHDKHMRIRPQTAGSPGVFNNSTNDAGFKEVKMLDNNIGYIDLRLFFPPSIAAPVADKSFKELAGAKAIIIDLRNNGGGSPDMVQYLCSYFFDKKIHLNSLYSRLTNSTREFWTIDVNGTKMPDIPLFILTSKRTFSGAEEFSYNMQTQKRATLIGETTGGGANPGGIFRINDDLGIFIPTGRAINPITGTNWEGVGVKPAIAVPVDEALEKAKVLAAQTPAKKYF